MPNTDYDADRDAAVERDLLIQARADFRHDVDEILHAARWLAEGLEPGVGAVTAALALAAWKYELRQLLLPSQRGH